MRLLFSLFFLSLIPLSAEAQFGSFGVTDARSLGMGNTYTATTYDLYAIGKNPGMLARREDPCKVTIIMPNITAQHYGVGKTLSTFDYYSSNKIGDNGLISINKEKFRLALENNGKLFVDALLGFFSVAYHPGERIGSFAFAMSDYITGYMDIPDVILDVNYGNDIPDGRFSLDNFDFKSWWLRTYTLSYSRFIYQGGSIYNSSPALIKNISGGITAKYVLAYAYTDIGLTANAYYSTATQTLSGSYNAHAIFAFSEDLGILNSFDQGNKKKPPGFLKLKPVGRGFGIDIGAGAELRKGWIVGLAVTDIGMIKWQGSARNSDFEGFIDISGVIDYQTLDSLSTGISLVRERREDFNTSMPTAARLGVALKFEEMFNRFPGKLLVGVDYNQGLNNQPSNYTASRFSLGFEYHYKPVWPIFLGGYTIDFLGISRAAIGLGYKTWLVDLYVSTIDIIPIVSGGDRFSASLVARWKLLCGRAKNRVPECY
ncbi:MAG TPA: DUF5723 family protein [Bacteroidales bacterium]|nr:DUF5723 family protein [Bacteroidales bacterium]